MGRELPILFNVDMVRAILEGRKTATRRIVRPTVWENFVIEGGKVIHYLNPTNDSLEDPLYRAPCQVGDILYARETWSINNLFLENYEEFYIIFGYRADGSFNTVKVSEEIYEKYDYSMAENSPEWRPSIHMPKEATRIWLKVTDVRVEQLQDITEEQAIREGIIRLYDDLPDTVYMDWAKRTGIYPKTKEDWGYKNYLWHGNFGTHGTGNKMSDAWEYQYSSYDSAIDSFSSLWNTTITLKNWTAYGWNANPWVWAIEFERCGNPEKED